MEHMTMQHYFNLALFYNLLERQERFSPTERLYHSVPSKPTQYLKRNVQPTQKYSEIKLVSSSSRGEEEENQSQEVGIYYL